MHTLVPAFLVLSIVILAAGAVYLGLRRARARARRDALARPPSAALAPIEHEKPQGPELTKNCIIIPMAGEHSSPLEIALHTAILPVLQDPEHGLVLASFGDIVERRDAAGRVFRRALVFRWNGPGDGIPINLDDSDEDDDDDKAPDVPARRDDVVKVEAS